MDRQNVYPGQILPETTLLQMTKDAMIGLAKLSAAVLGTSTTVNGFAVTPTSPASLQVNVAPGEIYSLQNVDNTAFSSLAADTTHQIVKQGISLDQQTLTLAAPSTTGQSINYLIQASYADIDSTPVLLPYYNSANHNSPYSGQGNNGLTQNTVRKGSVVLTAKAGVPATTGSQVTPAPDSGYVGLYVVTVAYGQTQIVAGNISPYSAAPFINIPTMAQIQGQSGTAFTAGGTAPSYALTPYPAITAYAANQRFNVTFPTAGTTGSNTINVNGLGALQLKQYASDGSLVSGVVAAGMNSDVQIVGAGSYALILDPLPTSSVGIAGQSSNLRMSLTSASSSATWTADEIVVETVLGGSAYKLSKFSQAVNLSTTGAGGMDAGAAPVSGFVAIYAGYNPTTGAKTAWATNATSAAAPAIYGGVNAPDGFTASALISVVPTNASGQFKASLYQYDRTISITPTTVLNTTSTATTLTSLSISGAVPLNATRVTGTAGANATSGNITVNIAGDNIGNGAGLQQITAAPVVNVSSNFSLMLATAQRIYYTITATGSITIFLLIISEYSI